MDMRIGGGTRKYRLREKKIVRLSLEVGREKSAGMRQDSSNGTASGTEFVGSSAVGGWCSTREVNCMDK